MICIHPVGETDQVPPTLPMGPGMQHRISACDFPNTGAIPSIRCPPIDVKSLQRRNELHFQAEVGDCFSKPGFPTCLIKSVERDSDNP